MCTLIADFWNWFSRSQSCAWIILSAMWTHACNCCMSVSFQFRLISVSERKHRWSQMLTCLNRSGSWLEGLKSLKRSKLQTKFLFSSSVCQLSLIPGFFLLRAFSLFRFHYLSALCPTHKQLFPFIYSMHTWKRISSCLCEPFLQRQVWVERPLGSRCRYCRTERWSILDHCGTTEGGAKGGVGAKSAYTCEDAGCSTLSLECLPFRHCSQTFPESLTHLSVYNSISISCQYPAMNSNSIYVHSFFSLRL